jgi:hypothetical protein
MTEASFKIVRCLHDVMGEIPNGKCVTIVGSHSEVNVNIRIG